MASWIRIKREFLISFMVSICAFLMLGSDITPAYADSDTTILEQVVLSGVVLLEHHATELQEKLGQPTCLVQKSDPSRTIYVYRASDGSFVSFYLNTSRAHVDHGRIIAIGMTRSLTLSSECQKMIPASHGVVPLQRDLLGTFQLGTSVDHITQQYGQPEDVTKDGTRVRMTFSRTQAPNHFIVWTFDFEHDQLIGWTVEAFPIFFEVAG